MAGVALDIMLRTNTLCNLQKEEIEADTLLKLLINTKKGPTGDLNGKTPSRKQGVYYWTSLNTVKKVCVLLIRKNYL